MLLRKVKLRVRMFSFQVFEFKLKQSDKNDKYLHSDVIETIKILGHLSQEQRL